MPLLENPDRPWNKAAFSEYRKSGNQGIAMRTDRYRYVEWRDERGELAARELYDHQFDPQENENVAEEPASAAIIQRLARQMADVRNPRP